MTNSQTLAYRLRKLILISGIVFTIAGIIWAVLPFFNEFFKEKFDFEFVGLVSTVLVINPVVGDSELLYGINLLVILGLLLLGQWAFLRPGKGWTKRMLTVGKPLRSSVIAAGVVAMLLTTGLIALLLELPNWWQEIVNADNTWGTFGIFASMLAIWGIWTWIFFVYWRQGDRYTQLGKMIRGLVAGSILETIIAVPVHIWATRQRECYCCRGTYTTLILAATVLIWVFGPGIVLLYMREKYRQAKLISICPNCGCDLQNMKDADSNECPQCNKDTP
ncbi:MAG TPA: hypothetical protein ENH94_00510 [Phycisphaerales bacterium]|nr:hypothetical protein [Phycisphaerales bacterium]